MGRATPANGPTETPKRSTARKQPKQFDNSLRKKTLVCRYCHRGLSSSELFFAHIYHHRCRSKKRKTGEMYLELGIRFKCGVPGCNKEFDTADHCDDHVEYEHFHYEHCGVYIPNGRYPTVFTRCAKTYTGNSASSSFSRHRTDCHSDYFIAASIGRRRHEEKKLNLEPTPQVRGKGERWLPEVAPLPRPPTPPTPPTPVPTSPEIFDAELPVDTDSDGPDACVPHEYAVSTSDYHYAAPVPTYPVNVDNTLTLTAPTPHWASGYGGTYSNVHSPAPSLSSSSSSRASTSYSPVSAYSPSTGSSMGDSFPSSPMFDANLYYGQSSFQGYGYPSHIPASNLFTEAAFTSVAESSSGYPGLTMGSCPSGLWDASTWYSYNAPMYLQSSPYSTPGYSPLEYDHSSYSEQYPN
ncbi:hypothetical protein QCA50_019975 [Cerrena zonata]|uniref:C2H2-type domain-containing protein n=1 Tax=Cerrena zonata TaxID=2478898 RepID=A0AAW0FB91_9APHY